MCHVGFVHGVPSGVFLCLPPQRVAGLYPADAATAVKVDIIRESVVDLSTPYAAAIFGTGSVVLFCTRQPAPPPQTHTPATCTTTRPLCTSPLLQALRTRRRRP